MRDTAIFASRNCQTPVYIYRRDFTRIIFYEGFAEKKPAVFQPKPTSPDTLFRVSQALPKKARLNIIDVKIVLQKF